MAIGSAQAAPSFSGSVYSFYQFNWPLSNRLTDTTWRQMLGIAVSDDNQYHKSDLHVERWTSAFQYERAY